MIKLIDILEEIIKSQPTPEEQRIIDDLLNSLNEGNFDDVLSKVKEYAKKGLLTTTILTALISSPKLTSAQKSQLNSIQLTQSTQLSNTGTQIDGINGQFTSQFIFPKAFIHDLNSGKIEDLGIEGQNVLKDIAGSKVSIKQMIEWNNFVKWMKDNKYSGNKNMDNREFSKAILEKYKKENSGFWVKNEDDIKKIQFIIKTFRKYIILLWKNNKTEIDILGKKIKPGVDNDSLSQFMTWAK